MIKISNLKKGFTLVELILYMSILSVLLSVMTSIFSMAVDVQLESEATSTVEQDESFILARLDFDMRRASDINIPGAPGNSTPNFQIEIDGINYTYSVDADGNLVLDDTTTVENLNSYGTRITNFNVLRLGNGTGEDTLKINFDIESKTQRVGVGPEKRIFETTVGLRRK